MIVMATWAQYRQAFTVAFARWGRHEQRVIRSAFLQGGHHQHGGHAWPPRRRSYPWPILLKTGKLRRSVRPRLHGMAVNLEASAEYASYHQYGTSRLPVRKVIDVTEADLSELGVILQVEARKVRLRL